MKKIIIGIHGLKNKPAPEVLSKWWKTSIQDGLNKLGFDEDFSFELVYWADLNYSQPLDPNETDPSHPQYIPAPYVPEISVEEQKASLSLKKRILTNLEASLDLIFLRENSIAGIDKIADKAMYSMFTDLDIYYHGFCQFRSSLTAKEAFRNCLVDVLQRHKNKQILLVAHSMGSIIAYDTLVEMGNEIEIQSLISLGSPLGLPIILKKILLEQNQEITPQSKPITPENITNSWYNFADLDDKVALIYRLANDFLENSSGIKPVDFQVNNRFQMNDEIRPHKAYGYLRTPEVAEKIFQFLKH